jgi:hypothetical protein
MHAVAFILFCGVDFILFDLDLKLSLKRVLKINRKK